MNGENKHHEIPDLDKLKSIINKRTYSPNHVWGDPVINFKKFQKKFDSTFFWEYVPYISSYCFCKVCGSKRTEHYKHHMISGNWSLTSNNISHSTRYHKSPCQSRWKKAKLFIKPEAKKRKELYERKKKRKKIAEEIREDQILQSFKIINELMEECGDMRGKETGEERKRIKLSVYRLYRYLDLSPRSIAEQIKLSESYVKDIIGGVFREKCFEENCVLKPYFTPYFLENE